MPSHLDSLSHEAKTVLLARIAHTLTICARDTYEVGTENVEDARTLRGYNEVLHQVLGAVVSHLSGRRQDSLQSIIEVVRSFGLNYGRAREMEWALNHSIQQVEKT